MFYPDDKVRLLQDLEEEGLKKGQECQVVSAKTDGAGNSELIEVKFYAGGSSRQIWLPAGHVFSVLSKSSEQRTAVFWSLEKDKEKLIGDCLNAMMDRGWEMMSGLNSVALHYDRSERWWKWGDPVSDPAGAHIAAAGAQYDGCIAAFSGRERFHLEFRLGGRTGAHVLLHEHDDAYWDQAGSTAAATRLAGLLIELYAAADAKYCAFPVADPWLYDEDWNSLFRHPYYPDFFLLPEPMELSNLPSEFRKGVLTSGRAILTTLPMKFHPDEELPKPGERDRQLSSMRKCASLGEKYYDQLYETRLNKTGLYSSMKDALIDAISTARQLGFTEYAASLDKRLDHCKSVFRSQFT